MSQKLSGLVMALVVGGMVVGLRSGPVVAQEQGTVEKEPAAKSSEIAADIPTRDLLPGEAMLKPRRGEPVQRDPRIAKLEVMRKALVTYKDMRLTIHQEMYLDEARNIVSSLMEELKFDDAIAVLRASAPVAKACRSRSAAWLEILLGQAQTGKATLIKIAPALRTLDQNPTNKEAARTVIESLLIDMNRIDLALRVAEQSQTTDLAEMLRMASRSNAGTANDFAAAGDWMMQLAKRSPAQKKHAQYRAYDFYAEAIRRNTDARQPPFSDQERNRIWGVLNSLPLPPGTPAEPTYGLVRVDVSQSGNREIDTFMESLEPKLIPSATEWSSEQITEIEELANASLQGKTGLAFKGTVNHVGQNPELMKQKVWNPWTREFWFTTRYGNTTYVTLVTPMQHNGPPTSLRQEITVTGNITTVRVSKRGLSIRLEGTIVSVGPKPLKLEN